MYKSKSLGKHTGIVMILIAALILLTFLGETFAEKLMDFLSFGDTDAAVILFFTLVAVIPVLGVGYTVLAKMHRMKK